MNLRLLLFCVFAYFSFTVSHAQNEFITTWQVSGGDLSIQIPTDNSNFTYDYTVDFGDGNILTNQTDDTSHTYASAGTYTVKISGTFPKFKGDSFGFDSGEIISVEQWGNIQWQSMESAFKDLYNLAINATDTPDLSDVTDMSFMFALADLVNSPNISTWDVSNVTNMKGLFANADSFNQPLNNWDVSSVTNMENMFFGADVFNQPLNNWDVSNVTSMLKMFSNTSAFNQSLNNWNVSNVTNMEQMFRESNFDQPLGNWNTSSVTMMRELFFDCPYNHPLNTWDVSNVVNMASMFEFNPYNHPLNNWNTGNVTNMDSMFRYSSFNQPLNSWDVNNVTNISFMFSHSDFNQPLNSWDVSNVEFMGAMFENSNFNQPLNNWNVSNVTSIDRMFRFSNFNQDISGWDVSSVDGFGFHDTFANSDFNQDISSWNFNASDLDGFIKYSAMDSQNYDLILGRFVQLGLENGYLDANGLGYCDIFTREKLVDDQGWNIFDDEIGDDCNVNYISGNIRFDEDGNGCDSNDEALEQFAVNVNDGNNDLSVLPDDQGDYLMTVNQSNFSVEMLNLPAFLDASPSAHAVSFSNTNALEDQKDFCITANQSIEDLSIELFPLDDAIPGFESDYELVVENNGTQPVQNAQVTINFDDTKQSFVSASQTPSGTTSNSVTFTINNLSILGSEVIDFAQLNVQPPDLNSGDILNFTAIVTPDANDINPDDNTVNFDQIVVNSLDPNDKLVTQGDEITIDKTDEYLDYKIRFQNVGTANAINVVLTDSISDKLDWTTFQPINSSHDYRLELVNQEEINFIFENINLPYEAVDELGSNGHVSFKIKPKSDVQIGDVIDNKAYIFFDFNAPIITNTVSTEVVDNLSTTDFVQVENIILSPNPAEERVEIINESNSKIQNIQLYTINGRLIKTYERFETLDVSSIANGMYLIKIKTDSSTINKRLIKK